MERNWKCKLDRESFFPFGCLTFHVCAERFQAFRGTVGGEGWRKRKILLIFPRDLDNEILQKTWNWIFSLYNGLLSVPTFFQLNRSSLLAKFLTNASTNDIDPNSFSSKFHCKRLSFSLECLWRKVYAREGERDSFKANIIIYTRWESNCSFVWLTLNLNRKRKNYRVILPGN